MKNYMGFVGLCGILVLAAYAPDAKAQSTVISYNDNQNTGMETGEVQDNEIQRAVDSALEDYYKNRGGEEVVTEDDNQPKARQVYNPDKKKALFHGADVPPRLFNNIPYPY